MAAPAALKATYATVGLLALVIGMFPMCWKIYETGYHFREASDPSRYDDMKEYFETSDLPFVADVDSPKIAYRVYFFVVPFVIGCWVVALKLVLAGSGGHASLSCLRKV